MGQHLAPGGIDLVDRQRHGLAEAAEHGGKVAVGGGDFGVAIHQEDDVRGARQDHFRLVKNLRGNVLLVVDHDAAGIDQLEAAARVFGKPVDAVARDAGLIADDRAPLPSNAIEESGLSNVGPAHNDHRGNGMGHET